MTTPEPRIPPLTDADVPEGARKILLDWPYNLHRVLARNLPTLTRWMPYAEHILQNNTLPEREREIAILRVAWNTQSAYEWGLHVRLARSLGFTDADIASIALANPADAHWQPHESAIIQGVDDIMTNWEVSDATWRILAANFDEQQLIDYVFVTCQFILVAVTLKTMRVPLEPDIEPLPRR